MIQERLQQLIDDIGWTQERLAKEIVTSPSTVSRWFSGKPISKTSMRRIADVLGVNPEWLQSGTGTKKITGGRMRRAPRLPDMDHDTSGTPSEINVHEGVMMTTKVLSSGTGYANALWHNLKSFDAAVEKESKVKELERKMDLMLGELAEVRKENAEIKSALGGSSPEKKSVAQ